MAARKMTNEATNLVRVRRKRAAVACLSCRERKVRCDVAKHGSPCTNCSLDKLDCNVKQRHRIYHTSRRAEGQFLESAVAVLTTITKHEAPIELPVPIQAPETVISTLGDSCDGLPHTGNNHSLEAEIRIATIDADAVKICSPCGFNAKDRHQGRNLVFEISHPDDPGSPATLWEKRPAGQALKLRSTSQAHVAFSHYPFIESDGLFKLSPEDFNLLEQQHCFRLPTRPLLDDLVKQYFLHVHPHLPILNEGHFWEMYTRRDPCTAQRPGLSLFVFQAMLFSSCCFLSQEAIHSLGFPNARSIRSAYYLRAKLLFDFDTQRDSISTAHGTLLLSYRTTIENFKMNTYWLQMAIHFARDGKAHLYYSSSNLTQHQKNTRKRLWWCCILRDRIISLGVRRPLQIHMDDFDVSRNPLVEDDFEDEIDSSNVYGVIMKSSLIQLLITLFDLAVVLTEVIMVAYPHEQAQIEAVNLCDETESQHFLRRIESCKCGLDRWFETATFGLRSLAEEEDANKSLILYSNLMYLYYHSAKVALYHRAALFAMKLSMSDEFYWWHQIRVKRQLEESIGDITDNLKELLDLNLAKYLPISVGAYVVLPLILHILDAKLSSTASQRARKTERFRIYIEAMKQFRSQYDAADRVCELVEKLVESMSLVNWYQPVHPQTNMIRDATPDTRNDRGTSVLLSKSLGGVDMNDWGDVLQYQPHSYLRLAMTVDLSLSHGKFPDDADFPTYLQSSSIEGSSALSLDQLIVNESNRDFKSDMENSNFPDQHDHTQSRRYGVDSSRRNATVAAGSDRSTSPSDAGEQTVGLHSFSSSRSADLADALGLRVDLSAHEMALAIHGYEGLHSHSDWAGEILFGTTCPSRSMS